MLDEMHYYKHTVVVEVQMVANRQSVRTGLRCYTNLKRSSLLYSQKAKNLVFKFFKINSVFSKPVKEKTIKKFLNIISSQNKLSLKIIDSKFVK